MSVRCGNCKENHDTVADVRRCYEGKAQEQRRPQPRPPHGQEGRWNSGQPCPIPPGRYAILVPVDETGETSREIITKFYKIDAPDEGRWKGYTFIKVQASDEFHSVRSQEHRERIINEILEQGWRECLLRYGQEIGKCGHCGRTLTNEESRAYGIGPICRQDPKLAAFV